MRSPTRTMSLETCTLARSAGAAMTSARSSALCATAIGAEAASRAEARMSERAIMANPQRNMLEVDCSIWSAALTTLAFIS